MMKIIGLGSAIVECLRIAQMIERHGETFLHQVYTLDEIEYCSLRSLAATHYARFWVGKRAVLQALGGTWSGGPDWRDIEIRPTRPQLQVRLRGVAEQLRVRRGAAEVMLSLAHCRSHASAYAIATG